jgi:uncharacterized protein YjbJ (UPF0337 family)
LGGKVQEGFGRVTGDTKTQAEGIANQVTGAAQDLYGRARDSTSEAADAALTAAGSFEKLLRNTIENQPYTTAIVATRPWLAAGENAPPALNCVLLARFDCELSHEVARLIGGPLRAH